MNSLVFAKFNIKNSMMEKNLISKSNALKNVISNFKHFWAIRLNLILDKKLKFTLKKLLIRFKILRFKFLKTWILLISLLLLLFWMRIPYKKVQRCMSTWETIQRRFLQQKITCTKADKFGEMELVCFYQVKMWKQVNGLLYFSFWVKGCRFNFIHKQRMEKPSIFY